MSTNVSSSSSSSGGIGFLGALTIAFVVLKLTGVISWSWLWVLSPLWIGAALALVIMALVVGAVLIWGGKWPRASPTRQGRAR